MKTISSFSKIYRDLILIKNKASRLKSDRFTWIEDDT